MLITITFLFQFPQFSQQCFSGAVLESVWGRAVPALCLSQLLRICLPWKYGLKLLKCSQWSVSFILPLCMHRCIRSSHEKAGQAQADQSINSNENFKVLKEKWHSIVLFFSQLQFADASLLPNYLLAKGEFLSYCCPLLIVFSLLTFFVFLFMFAFFFLLLLNNACYM